MTISKSAQLALTFELAREDAPEFRAIVHKMEDEVEKISQWIELIVKALRSYIDQLNRANDMSSQLGVRSIPQPPIDLIQSQPTMDVLRTFTDSLQCVFSFKAKMIDDMQELLLVPLQAFLKEDVRAIRENRRIFERISDRYDGALQRYYSLSKLKEASALREDAFQLYDIRKAYIRTSLDYTNRLIQFKTSLDHLLLGQFTEGMDSIMEFYSSAAEVYRGFLPRLDELKQELMHSRAVAEVVSTQAQQRKTAIEDGLFEVYKPSTALPTRKSTASSLSKPLVTNDTPIEKEGYLFRRIQKSSLVVPQWVRRWCFIRGGKFGIASLSRQRGATVYMPLLSVLLFEVKINDIQDRRFCFDLVSNKKTFSLQAETEEEFQSWMATFEAAKMHELQSADQDTDDDNLKSVAVLADDDEMENQSVIKLFRPSTDELSPSKSAPESTSALEEKKERSPSPPDFEYPDKMLARRNDELHGLLPIPVDELLIESFPAQLQQTDQLIQGRIYLTEQHICFYSNILGSVATVVLPFSQVRSIQKRTVDSKNAIVISSTTPDGLTIEHVLMSQYRHDIKTLGSLNTIFWNHQSHHKMTFVELFAVIYKSYRNAPSIEDAGSRNLSMTEMKSYEEAATHLKRVRAHSQSAAKALNASKENLNSSAGSSSGGTGREWPAGAPPMPSSEVKNDLPVPEEIERAELDMVLPLPAHELWAKLFENGAFFEAVHKKRNDWDITVSEWTKETPPTRKIRWMFVVNNPMVKVKETDCVEEQTIIKRDDYLCYIVDTNSKTVNLPYGDAFQTATRFVLTFVSKDSCRLHVSIGLKWFKSPLVKSIIKGAAIKGLSEYLQDFGALLKTELGSAPGIETVATGSTAPTNLGKKSKEISVESERKEPAVSSWIPEVLQDYLVPLVTLALLLFAYFIASRIFWPSSLRSYRSKATFNVPCDLRSETLHGLYMVDLEEQVLNSTMTAQHSTRDLAKRASFSHFLQQSTSSPEYAWFNTSLQQESKNVFKMLHHSRKLRLQLVKSLVTLNEMEKSMLESQYTYWLRDQIQFCWEVFSQTVDSAGEATDLDPSGGGSIGMKRKMELACKRLELDLQLFIIGSDEDG